MCMCVDLQAKMIIVVWLRKSNETGSKMLIPMESESSQYESKYTNRKQVVDNDEEEYDDGKKMYTEICV